MPVVVTRRPVEGRMRRPIASFVAVAAAVALLAGLTGCSLIGDVMQRETTPAENHKYQRITAVNTKKYWPNIDVITFIEKEATPAPGHGRRVQWSR
jgi:hypothetical protein